MDIRNLYKLDIRNAYIWVLPFIETKLNRNNKLSQMKNIKHLIILTSIMLLSSFVQPIYGQDNVFIKEYLERLEKSKQYLILVAETMPEDKRGTILENYLKSIGYIFDKEAIEEVVEKVKRIKRKPGTRPVNYIRKRIKSQ